MYTFVRYFYVGNIVTLEPIPLVCIHTHIHIVMYDNMYFRAYSRARFPAPVLEYRLSKQNMFLLHTGTRRYLSNTIQPIVDFQHFTITGLCVSDE